MRYAIVSDIHANLEAFRAVLERIAVLKADRIVCLGDITGYNADPGACIAIVREGGIASIAGNHDTRAAGLEPADAFNPAALRAVHWTRHQLSEDERAFLAALPRERTAAEALLVHGSIGDTDRYLLSPRDLRDNFSMLAGLPGPQRVCFYGHTHLPAAFSSGGADRDIRREPEGPVMIDHSRFYLVNPGAVGQPRDGDARAAFAVYDTSDGVVTFHRVAYDIAAAQDKIVRAGLPAWLAERLEQGR